MKVSVRRIRYGKSLALLLASAVVQLSGLPSAYSDSANSSPSDFYSHLGGSVGASWSAGQLGNDEMGLKVRTVNTFSLEALPSYRLNEKFLFGLAMDYRWQAQTTSLADAGGTNLKGQGYLIGIGSRFFVSERFAIQTTLNLLGRYEFTNPTHVGEDDHLNSPIGVKAKAQYFFSSWPLSADAGFEFLRWQSLTVTSTDFNRPSTQWMVGIGLTYHFGSDGKFASAPTVSEPTKAATPAPTPVPVAQQLEAVLPVTKTDKGSMINLSGDVAFSPNSSELSQKARETLIKIAQIIGQSPNGEIVVEGHTDSSGQRSKNQALSQARAEAVKSLLIESGVQAERIRAVGLGQSRPVTSNTTKEGRAQNRRVEIYVQEVKE